MTDIEILEASCIIDEKTKTCIGFEGKIKRDNEKMRGKFLYTDKIFRDCDIEKLLLEYFENLNFKRARLR
jgi:hypothetical protein